jgi:hypothetical protein
MKTRMSAAALALVGILAASAFAEEPKAARAEKGAGGSYVHVVIFRMKKDAPGGAVDEVIADCHGMLGKIAAVRSVKVGRPAAKATPKLASKDYDLGLLILVDDSDGLTSYLEDPLHLKFVEKHGKFFDMEKLQVFDFQDTKK